MRLKQVVIGGAAGLAATVPMTAMMLLGYCLLPPEQQYALPQEEIVESLTETVGTHEYLDSVPAPSPESPARLPLEALGLLSHFGYGTAAGTAYALLAQANDSRPALRSLIFGLLLWAFGYLGWLPALGVLTPATDHPRGRTAMIVAHLVWGPITALLVQRWEKSLA